MYSPMTGWQRTVIGKEAGSWHDLRSYPGVLPEGLTETTKNINEDNPKHVFPEYKSKALPYEATCLEKLFAVQLNLRAA
jgi:hypothetical protein